MPSWEEYCLSQESNIQKMFPNKNIKHPSTFTEKIQWLKIHDSSFLKTYCTDKITVHEYCKKKLGKDICIPILKVYNNVDEIDLSELPKSFVIKCNHGSAMNIIVEDKSKLNLSEAKMKLKKWLNTDFSKFSELHYKLIPRKIYIEEFKSNIGKSDLTDYKLFCFNGVPRFWQVITDRRTSEKISHYDMDWKYAPIYDWRDYGSISNIPRPENYELMVEYAKKLSADFKMVRVDFYEIDGMVYLGELTFTPANGKQIFKNSNADKLIGDMLQLQ